MGLQNTFNMVVSQCQFVGLLNKLDVEWPTKWKEMLEVIDLSNLNPEDIIGKQELPVIDFRMLFILITQILPLSFTFILLMMFQPLVVVLWYAIVVTGFVSLAAGLLGRYLPDAGHQDATAMSETLIIFGAALLGFALISFAVRKCKRGGDDLENTRREVRAKHEAYVNGSGKKQFILFIVAGALIFAGLILTGRLPIDIQELNDVNEKETQHRMVEILGFVLLALGACVALYFFITCFRCGREAMLKVMIFMNRNLLMIMLLAISCSFVPVVVYAVNMFLCTEYTCPRGYKFNPYGFRPSQSYSTSTGLFCDPCTWENGCAWQMDTMCPPFKGQRLWKHPSVPCDDEGHAYFMVAAAIVLVAYVFLIPKLWHSLIHHISNVIDRDAVIADADNMSRNRLWEAKVYAAEPAAASLYQPFQFQHRFYTIVVMIHKLLVVLVLVVIAPFSSAAVAIVLGVHAVACFLMLLTRPFLIRIEAVLGTLLAVCNVLNGLYAVIVWQKRGDVPQYTTYIFVVCNVILPAVGVVVILIIRRQRREAHGAAKEAEEGRREPNSGEMEMVKEAPTASAESEHQPNTARMRDTPRLSPPPSARPKAKARSRSKTPTKTIAEKNAELLATVDEFTGQTISKYFMIIGVLLFLALGCSILGSLRQKDSEYTVGSNQFLTSNKYTLAGRSSWADFATECCCLRSQNPSKNYNTTERWVCNDGRTVDRGRVSKDLGDNGINLRDVCSKTFTAGCALLNSASRPEMACTDPIKNSVTSKAYRTLW